jgi:hypothetical protein
VLEHGPAPPRWLGVELTKVSQDPTPVPRPRGPGSVVAAPCRAAALQLSLLHEDHIDPHRAGVNRGALPAAQPPGSGRPSPPSIPSRFPNLHCPGPSHRSCHCVVDSVIPRPPLRRATASRPRKKGWGSLVPDRQGKGPHLHPNQGLSVNTGRLTCQGQNWHAPTCDLESWSLEKRFLLNKLIPAGSLATKNSTYSKNSSPYIAYKNSPLGH